MSSNRYTLKPADRRNYRAAGIIPIIYMDKPISNTTFRYQNDEFAPDWHGLVGIEERSGTLFTTHNIYILEKTY